jgi:hypothetical protein
MKRNLLIIAVPVAIAASFLAGCNSEKVTAHADPGRSSIVQVQEGYDTVGVKWEGEGSQPAQTTQYSQPKQSSDSAQYSQYPPPAQSKMITRSDAQMGSFSGTITDIDYANREVTLKGSQGRTETFSVSKDVQRFNQAKVGDKVAVDYYFGFNAEVRKPTAEEKENPLVLLQATGRTSPSEAPAGADMRQIRAVVTIESLDRADQTITVKGPRGKHYSARVADPSNFDKVHIGDTIVLTFTEAAAISLNPAN